MELQELMENRSSMYGFLARLYRVEVDQALLEQMDVMDFSVETGEPKLDKGYRLMSAYLAGRNSTTLLDLARDYAHTFLAAGLPRWQGAYPYESVYTSEKHLMMQDARDQVLALYRQEGLHRAEEYTEPEDHIAFELEYMAYLCEQTWEALDEGDQKKVRSYLEKQRAFLDEHLYCWVPTFSNTVQKIAQQDFYKAVAKITAGFLKTEKELFCELLTAANENE